MAEYTVYQLAFPQKVEWKEDGIGFEGEDVKSGTVTQYAGMNIRDYFAAKAMQGMMANPSLFSADGEFRVENFTAAYAAADAMLAARGE